MSVDDRILATAVERWTRSGMDCAICPTAMGFSGYVRVPVQARTVKWHGQRITDAAPDVSYGPDEHGWIGIDTTFDNGYWPAEALRHHPAQGVTDLNRRIAQMAFETGWGHAWTMDKLHSAVEAIADAVVASRSIESEDS